MSTKRTGSEYEDFDVLIIGAGISGIGAACYLQRTHSSKSYLILEARAATGGTWDLFRYPGIRSDSDLHTFGYAFKPWTNDKSIAGAEAILAYLHETAKENGIDRHVRLGHKVLGAQWSTQHARWIVSVERTDTRERLFISCRWLFCASGYYRYDRGHTPQFKGRERFLGRIVHPQQWPEDLDYTDKRVVVIGSGATAITLVPAMAEKARLVTMLQRTPTYILPRPSEDEVANFLRRILPAEAAYALTRRKNIAEQRAIYWFCRKYPDAAKRFIRYINVRSLPEGYPVDEHFRPPYEPWDQRLCLAADGDLFKAIRDGRADVVTDRIDTFTEKGLRLISGKELEADIVVTATGLELLALGGIELSVDGTVVNLPERVAYKGTMLDGVPNFAYCIGYTNASWTLKVGLLCEHFCKLLARMDANGATICYPKHEDPSMPTRPLLDFQAGYVKRASNGFPQQGTKAPWTVLMDYAQDAELFANIDDEHLHFSTPPRDNAPHALQGG